MEKMNKEELKFVQIEDKDKLCRTPREMLIQAFGWKTPHTQLHRSLKRQLSHTAPCPISHVKTWVEMSNRCEELKHSENKCLGGKSVKP